MNSPCWVECPPCVETKGGLSETILLLQPSQAFLQKLLPGPRLLSITFKGNLEPVQCTGFLLPTESKLLA